MSFIFRPGGGGGGTPGGSNGQVQVNVAGAFGAFSTFTYASNVLGVESITGTALGMTIQPKAPTVLETSLNFILKTPNAAKANTPASAIRFTSGNGLGTGDGGSVAITCGNGGASSTVGGSFRVDTGWNGNFDFGSTLLVSGPQVTGSGGIIEMLAGFGNTTHGYISLSNVHGAQTGIKIATTGFSFPGTTLIGFFGATPAIQQTISAAATDPATTQTLANSLRTAIINLGLGV